jgi:transcriptional regulator with XRE-family HTH domain
MAYSLQEFGGLVRAHREARKFSQEDLAAACIPPTNRSVVAHLEQGRRRPPPQILKAICAYLSIPDGIWKPFTDVAQEKRLDFEEALGELVGEEISLRAHDATSLLAAQDQLTRLFDGDLTKEQAIAAFNSVLVYYGVRPTSKAFFERYLDPDAFKSREAFLTAVRRYQVDAIRLYSTLADAFERMNSARDLTEELAPLAPRADDDYRSRTPWDAITRIADDRLPDLGYISAARIRRERGERLALSTFLKDLAAKVRVDRKKALEDLGEKKKRKMDSLLRQFQSSIQHGLASPLFAPDADQLEREAEAVAPKEEEDLALIGATQATAQGNLSHYLAADYLDVYVATSMRSDADFVSVNDFTNQLFGHDEVRPLKLRYFNPTQSWIDDRVAKGLVEALMLRRSTLTIYMAQKEDTFGKDSEASVALGQGKPVVVYVPKLVVPEADIDSEKLGRTTQSEILSLVQQEGTSDDKDLDDTVDHQALLGRLLEIRLGKVIGGALATAALRHWADFDLYGEAGRIGENERAEYRKWLDDVRAAKETMPSPNVAMHFLRVLVATTVRFEQRARVFREVHPLALQVILSSGVLNGILVSRSVDTCARLVKALLRNDLLLDLIVDENNYRLVEKLTGSTVRVISRHRLIGNAFSRFYLPVHQNLKTRLL